MEVHGTPTRGDKHDYPTEYRVKDKQGEWHMQCNCIVLVTVRKAEERTQAELEVATSYVESKRSDDPPSPPPRQCKKREEKHAVDNDEELFPKEDDEDNSGGGGKCGRGGGGGGGGKRKKGF